MNIKHAALAAICVAATTAAFGEEPPTVTLQLHGPVDAIHAQQVYARIQTAARVVCAQLESRELEIEHLHRQCLEQAVEKAVAQVGSQALTNVHLARLETAIQ